MNDLVLFLALAFTIVAIFGPQNQVQDICPGFIGKSFNSNYNDAVYNFSSDGKSVSSVATMGSETYDVFFIKTLPATITLRKEPRLFASAIIVNCSGNMIYSESDKAEFWAINSLEGNFIDITAGPVFVSSLNNGLFSFLSSSLPDDTVEVTLTATAQQ